MNFWPYIVVLLVATALGIHLAWRGRYRKLQEEFGVQARALTSLARERDHELLERSAQQEVVFNSMSEGVLVLDGDHRIQLVNRSLRKMFALGQELRGKSVLESFQPHDLSALLDRLKRDKTVEGYELVLPGAEERMLELNAAAILDRSGKQRGSILVFHDQTRIKQLENTRQEFVANVSHELRTPLSLIKGYIETLLEGAMDDQELANRFLHTIEKHTNRLAFLIEDILTISKLESGQIVMNLQPLNVHDEISRVLEDLKSVAEERRITIENGVPLELMAMADAGRLEQVFFNLVENAIKYGRREGRVQVGAKERPDGMLEIWVKDDGPGIPSEALERVFERFYRVDRARSRDTGGTGLGLSIVKHIVQGHGGEVWARSELGKGTTFFLTLQKDNMES